MAEIRSAVLARVDGARRRLRGAVALAGISRLAGAMLGAACATLLLDLALAPSLTVRLLLMFAVFAGLAWLGHRWLIAPLMAPLPPVALAGLIDRARRAGATKPPDVTAAAARDAGVDLMELAPGVATVLQLSDVAQPAGADVNAGSMGRPHGASASLARQAVAQAARRLDQADWSACVRPGWFFRHGMLVAGIVVAAGLATAARPDIAWLWAQRWLLGQPAPWPVLTRLSIDADLDGDGVIVTPQGEPFLLRVLADPSGVMPEQVTLEAWVVGDGRRERLTMSRLGDGDFRHTFARVTQPMELIVRGGDASLGPVKLTPHPRPRLTDLTLTGRRPDQSADEAEVIRLGDGRAFAFLRDSEVTLTFTADRNLASATLAPAVGSADGLARLDDRRWRVAWRHAQAVRAELTLVGAEHGLASRPIPIAVAVRHDQPPQVRLEVVGLGRRITPLATAPLGLHARDDMGLTGARLAVAVSTPEPVSDATQDSTEVGTQASTPASANEPAAPELDGPWPDQTPSLWDTDIELTFEPWSLAPGATLMLQLVATDNHWPEPQVGRSAPRYFDVVEPAELLADLRLRLQGARAKLRAVREEAQALRAELNVATRTRELSLALPRHRASASQVRQIAQTVDGVLTELKLNRLGAAATHQLLDAMVIQPARALVDGLMAEQAADLARGAAQADALDAGMLDSITGRQERIVARLDALLERMAQWDSFIDVINQLDEVIRLQERVRAVTDRQREASLDELFED